MYAHARANVSTVTIVTDTTAHSARRRYNCITDGQSLAMSLTGTSGCVGKVKVVVRTKPTAKFAHDKIELGKDGKSVGIHLGRNDDQIRGYINNKQQDWSFPVDAVLHDASQESVYETCARDLVVQLMRGFNGTLLAYGETGAGKTYTMCGPPSSYQARGVIPRAIAQVFSEVKDCKEYSYRAYVSYLEIYNEVIYDLLATLPVESDDVTITSQSPLASLTIAEDERRGVYVKGLTCRQADNEEEALNMLFEGEMNRTIAEHSMNKHSSRSHCIFTITVEARSHTLSSAEYTVSRLHLVDLAGSERLSKTQPTGATEKEAMYINRSLSFLEQVIIALSDSSRDHVPYRQSKLTHILRDSLGGNSHTVLIANVWAELAQIPETLSTLRFASRVRCVSTNPVRNTLKDPQLLVKEYEREIETLKEELAMHNILLNRGAVSYDPLSGPDIEEIRQQVRGFLNGTLTDIELVSVRQVKEIFAQFKAMTLSAETTPSTDVHAEPAKTTAVPQSTSRSKKDSKVRPSSPEAAQTVGDTEGGGLGLGIAPASHKHPASPATALKKGKTSSKNEARRKDSKSSSKRTESPAVSLATDEELAPSEIGSHVTRPTTPPTKVEAFEDFKKQRGSEINKVFLNNKATLHQKKKEAVELSTSINTIKKKMDELQALLSESAVKSGGASGDDVESVRGENGEVVEGEVMEEWEFNALTQLQELKTNYRQLYTHLQTVQQEVVYCSQYVTQSRGKLVEEFERWYRAAFIGDVEEEKTKVEPVPVDEEHEAFDTLQTTVNKESPVSAAFYAAQLRTEKRVYRNTTAHVTAQGRRRTGLTTT